MPQCRGTQGMWFGSTELSRKRFGGNSWWYTQKCTAWGRREGFPPFLMRIRAVPRGRRLCLSRSAPGGAFTVRCSDIHLDLMLPLSSTWTQSKRDDCALQSSERCPKNTALSCPPVSKIYPRGFLCYTAIRFSKSICCLQHISFPSLFHPAHCVCSALAAAAQSKIKPPADKLGFTHEKNSKNTRDKRQPSLLLLP